MAITCGCHSEASLCLHLLPSLEAKAGRVLAARFHSSFSPRTRQPPSASSTVW